VCGHEMEEAAGHRVSRRQCRRGRARTHTHTHTHTHTQDVVAAIGGVAREHGGLDEKQVEAWLEQLASARRLQIECW